MSRTIVVRKSVKKVKLRTKPKIMPNGRFLSPLMPERTIGRIGKIHGDKIVTIPAKKANSNKSIIVILFYNSLFYTNSQVVFILLKLPY